ncbi:CHAT domain-containing protein [Ancylothrix sp. C2]|uniref:CHAT domain-containing protein n=1 Tax=Ancylothrix sp. D3o TaxID=2953691 RepID=UPI0021BB938B|nr:CHAT domain-containing protein [Ancylothrix sp. D3o]MCT7951496.1 CHAT domain-containing protein [Ancylothrix sp. D3o]
MNVATKWAFLPFLGLFFADIAQSQPLIPAPDGTGTSINSSVNQFNITGGQLSADGVNLFHSFTRFNVDYGKVANFVSNPSIQNILTRINGGDVSYINGIIQLTGGNSNLFLMNPAGIVFGKGAALNVPADFTATTATAIGFNNGWFDSSDTNNYSALIGTPNSFYFALSQPAPIVNLGNLTIATQNNLNLLAGTVLSTGTLNAPQGNLIIATVAGQNTLKISQPGHLLSLELNPSSIPNPQSPIPNPQSLPQLLTGGNILQANQFKINPDGSIQLTNSDVFIQPGDIFAQNLSAQNAHLLSTSNLTLSATGILPATLQFHTTGNLSLKAANTVRIRDSATSPLSIQAGGDLLIQGNESIDILALNHPGIPFQSGGNLTLVSDGAISGDSHFAAGGNFSILNLSGNSGQFVSLYDPIIRANGDVIFGDYTGVSLKIEAKGSITGGDITITAPDLTLAGSSTDPDIEILTSRPALILRSDVENFTPNNAEISPQPNFTLTEQPITTGITVNNIIINNPDTPENPGGPVIFSAKGPITAASIDSKGGEINLNSANSTLEIAASLNSGGGDVLVSAQNNITLADIFTNGANLTLTSSGSIDTKAGNLDTTSVNGGGDITINSAQNLTTGNLLTNSGNITISANSIDTTTGTLTTQTGTISLTSENDLNTAGISSNEGDIVLTSNNGSINTTAGTLSGNNITIAAEINLSVGSIISRSGNINLTTAAGDIDTRKDSITGNSITINSGFNIFTNTLTAEGGNINLTATNEIDTTGGILNTSSATGNSGNIIITAPGNITTGNINANSQNNNAAGIFLQSNSGAVNTGNLFATGINGGEIRVFSIEPATLGNLDVSAINPILENVTSRGGNITLSSNSNILVNTINAQGAIGGNVIIGTAGLFRAGGTFQDQNNISASISAAGTTTQGSITIRHNGGCGEINCTPTAPFFIGLNAQNGTQGAITTSAQNSILPVQIFNETYNQGNIAIITATPPQPEPEPTPNPSPQPIENPPNNQANITQNQFQIDFEGKPIPLYRNLDLSTLENLQARGLRNFEENAILGRSILRLEIENLLEQNQPEDAVVLLEKLRRQEFEQHFNRLFEQSFSIETINSVRDKLRELAAQTGTKPAIIYSFVGNKQLELVAVTFNGQVYHQSVPEANEETLFQAADKFRAAISNQLQLRTQNYLPSSQQLYNLLIAPIEPSLQSQQIDTLLLSMDGRLRSVPVAALHDNQQFLIEKYRLSLVPSLNLTNTRITDIKSSPVLAMGASNFQTLPQLPAVPVEVSAIANQLRTGKEFINENFTLENLSSQHETGNYGIIHLATHGEFEPGEPKNSYIQLWDTQLSLDRLRQLQLNSPQVNLLVLSACRTALGDEKAELGFAGLAVQSGVNSALASLWYVSDAGTLALMLEFYRQLNQNPIKAEALRQAQLSLIRGDVRIEKGRLFIPDLPNSVTLPPELAQLENINFSHPFYWSGFTLIGSPW